MFFRNALGALMLLGIVLFGIRVIREAFAIWPGERLHALPFVSAELVRFAVILIVGLVLTVSTAMGFFGATGVFVEQAQKSWGSWFMWTSIVVAGYALNAAITSAWAAWLRQFGPEHQMFPLTGQAFLNVGLALVTLVWWWVATAARLLCRAPAAT